MGVAGDRKQVRKTLSDEAVAGAFEELPVLLVVLVAVSLFSVSVAHSAASWGAEDDYSNLQEDCQAFSEMVRSSRTLCLEGRSGIYDYSRLQNMSQSNFFEEFNSTLLGFEYRVIVQCLDTGAGNISQNVTIRTSEMPKGAPLATFSTCVSVDFDGRMGAARLTATIWRPVP